MDNRERINVTPENNKDTKEIEKAGAERSKELEQLRNEMERSAEKSQENLDEARHEALDKASSIEKEQKQETERQASPAERRTRGPASKAERQAVFKATMKEVQSQLPASSRAFSKIIHNKTVEKVSDTVGSTVARPNAILSGAVAAFLLTLSVYLLAKNLGYQLSGFETIAAFVLGWAIGTSYDFLKVMVTGRK